MAEVDIREATPDDVADIARVHVESWQAAYRGIVPDEVLDNLSAERRASAWRDELGKAHVPLVAVRDARIIGFVGYGPAREEDVADLGELYAIYVSSDQWDTGAGAALMRRATERLRVSFAAAVLWVLRDNVRARRFYERGGWVLDGTEQVLEHLGNIVEVRYRVDF